MVPSFHSHSMIEVYMLIEILRNTVADGLPVKAGDVVEVAGDTAKTLILLRKAKKAEEIPAGVVPEAPTDPVQQPAALVDDPQDGIEAAIDPDPDLGEVAAPEGDGLDPLSFEALVEMATALGIPNPAKLKKNKLIEAIRVVRSK